YTLSLHDALPIWRIFIDFHRNARGHTSVAAYSLRARTNLPASTPVSWIDLESIDAPEDLNYSSLPGLLSTSGDPWADIDEFAKAFPILSVDSLSRYVRMLVCFRTRSC